MTKISRKTKETNIEVSLDIYGTGKHNISTGIGFFDHMLEAFAKHSRVDLDVYCVGDIDVDYHHSVEDVGIVIGQAMYKELYPIENIERYASRVAILDEAAVECDLDIGGRLYLVYELPIDGAIRDFDLELVEEFFKSLVFNSKIACHLVLKRGRNRHHIIEAAFKAFAISFRSAIIKNNYGIPSTKGVL